MKLIIEVVRKPYVYDDSVSPSDNAYLEKHFSSTYSELTAVRKEFSWINDALKVGLEIKDYIDSFVVVGDIPEDVLCMFEEILDRSVNDDFDKFDYCIKKDLSF